jgi:predicted amidophosphoribosyltransferase
MDLCLGCESDFPFIVGTVPTYALCRYEFPMDYLITQIKFHGQLVYAKVLGELLAEKLPEIQAEVLIPVPLHPTRLRERGYNQALELARPLAKKRKIPLDIFSCTRIRSTQPQMAMSATKRAENLKDAFTVNPNFKTKHVAMTWLRQATQSMNLAVFYTSRASRKSTLSVVPERFFLHNQFLC